MSEKGEILELYRMMVDTVIANEQRRQQISSVYITLMAAGTAAAGAIKDFDPIFITIPGAFVSLVWCAQVRFLKRLAAAKFHVIGQLEENLSYKPFEEEWRFLKRIAEPGEKKRTWYRLGLSEIEMMVPIALSIACGAHIIARFVLMVFTTSDTS